MTTRLDPSTFDIPLAEIRSGWNSALYFSRAKELLEAQSPNNFYGTMQVFQKNQAVLCGIDEALAILKLCSGYWSNADRAKQLFAYYIEAKQQARRDSLNFDKAKIVIDLEQELDSLWVKTFDELEVKALNDGYHIDPWVPVLQIKGLYSHFAHLESVYLGVLARGTRVATNTSAVVSAAGAKQVLFFADRFDRWSNQTADGYAAYIGGAQGVASDSMAYWWGAVAIGTMPHALISCYKGDTVAATQAFNDMYPDIYTISLVDFNNDCVNESVKVARALGKKLYAVRLDTSENVCDPSVTTSKFYGQYKPTGVSPALVEQVRQALDDAGYSYVKIIVSGGFNAEKIALFERLGLLVDGYAVGSSLLSGNFDFTADLVEPAAKVGRYKRDVSRLQLVK